jgi:hypothetical protein
MAGLPNGSQLSLCRASIVTYTLTTGSSGVSGVVLEKGAPMVDDPQPSSQAMFMRGSRDKLISELHP